MNPREAATRKRLYALLHIASSDMGKRVPGWSADDYQHVLKQAGAQQVDGRYSAKTMSVLQLERALELFKGQGFKPKKSRSIRKDDWRAARIAMLNAMWCDLAEAGAVNDRSEAAMKAWCKNQVPKLTRLEWADSFQLNQAVEMLKQFRERVVGTRAEQGAK